MNASLFDSLARSGIVRNFEESLPVATGFMLKLQPVDGTGEPNPFGAHANPFCRLMSRSPQARKICDRTFAAIRDKAAHTSAPSLSCCFAGFAHIAIPVVSAGEHIATIYGGQLLLDPPTEQAFEKISHSLVRLGLGNHLSSLETAWFRTPVISDEQLQAIMHLLKNFADRISRYAATSIFKPVEGEPANVTRTRKFVEERFADPITLPDVLEHLQICASNFSKIFKCSVGIPFTQYLARFRVEKSKSMLANPTMQIRKIAFKSGFESVSQFNRSFRQYAEMTPTQYRASLAGDDPAVATSRGESNAISE
jgi:AraC-like DNA-binding protein